MLQIIPCNLFINQADLLWLQICKSFNTSRKFGLCLLKMLSRKSLHLYLAFHTGPLIFQTKRTRLSHGYLISRYSEFNHYEWWGRSQNRCSADQGRNRKILLSPFCFPISQKGSENHRGNYLLNYIKVQPQKGYLYWGPKFLLIWLYVQANKCLYYVIWTMCPRCHMQVSQNIFTDWFLP